jgi:hypothetical protein
MNVAVRVVGRHVFLEPFHRPTVLTPTFVNRDNPLAASAQFAPRWWELA